MISPQNDIAFAGKKITVMGLGLHGGGLASARFLAERGAEVTVTDLRDAATLSPSIEALQDLPIRYVLGRHELSDFSSADMVIKNPAVPRTSPYLKAARRIETDISLFLRLNRRPVLSVTGSKGKSTTVSALYEVLRSDFPEVLLGGNITVSPLTFVEDCLADSASPVILELSSWQLADIQPAETLRSRIALISNIMADHQNSYSSMDEYVADKLRIFAGQKPEDHSLCPYDDAYGELIASKARGIKQYLSSAPLPDGLDGAFLDRERGIQRYSGEEKEILPAGAGLPGRHNRMNLLAAGAIASLFGAPLDSIRNGLSSFKGIEHRMEYLGRKHGIDWYNDSAATIPDATAAALQSLPGRVHLIAGGTDKKLDFSPFEKAAALPTSIHLLEGSATVSMIKILDSKGIAYFGPFHSLEAALQSVRSVADDGETVLFSPGSTSFGMFLNEFDRGRQFKALIEAL